MPLVITLAVRNLGMSVTEALRAATIGGAHALRAPDRGAMSRGRYADIVAWDADHEGAFAWSYGLKPLPRLARRRAGQLTVLAGSLRAAIRSAGRSLRAAIRTAFPQCWPLAAGRYTHCLPW